MRVAEAAVVKGREHQKVHRFTRRKLARLRKARELERRAAVKEERPTRGQLRKTRNVDEMLKGCADR